MEQEIRILMLEDSPEDEELVLHALRKGGLKFTAFRVQTREDFAAALLEYRPDLILSDYQLPTFDGISALAMAVIEAPEVPFIFVSGALGEELALETLKGGATDYIYKEKLNKLVPSVDRALGEAREKKGRLRAEGGLKLALSKLQKVLEQTVNALASVTEIRDPYTAGHQRRVSMLACEIATEFGLHGDLVDGIKVAGSLHDIGKIAIPSEILAKPSKLLDVEFALVKGHSTAGYEILKDIDFLWPVAQTVYQHHERFDGSGYPCGLKGQDILPEARIIAVADVVEAMASHRPYRPAHGIDTALNEVARGRGVLYDPEAADACLRLFREKRYRLV